MKDWIVFGHPKGAESGAIMITTPKKGNFVWAKGGETGASLVEFVESTTEKGSSIITSDPDQIYTYAPNKKQALKNFIRFEKAVGEAMMKRVKEQEEKIAQEKLEQAQSDFGVIKRGIESSDFNDKNDLSAF